MELVFLGVLLLLMILALTSGYPVAFALPGSAIGAIALAALFGYIFTGSPDAYFAQDGPSQWLSAGVTNFRSLYWIVERDTLIAIPLFIFMGIMLQRSKIAEDLLVAMAQLFGPISGGLGISVVFVGALLAATTGIVGATVIAMGLISLPAMLRNNYSKSLASGTICASGTLGQIIPPSIVLIILADQLSSAADQANVARKAQYRELTGEFTMPSSFEVISASAGDMFMGAMIPGVILVLIYMLYILVISWIKPSLAPPVPYDGEYNRDFYQRVFLSLVPPLLLIFAVLGSILTGVATVNQAGAIGAIGAMIMAGYRLHEGARQFWPAILAVIALAAITIIRSQADLNVKSIKSTEQFYMILMAAAAVVLLLIAVCWSAWRTFKTDDTLTQVMLETAKTTSMVFIILIGAAMLTSAFRAFGGEELVKHYLEALPGGFWAQFLVVMVVIFLLGFFLDFIEIAVVVVPIIAPILLANPEANVTAVWLGVMIGLNIQTSFLTPPFGFALFYLRGVADKVIKTLDIYKGAAAFIVLQLLGLGVAGAFPALVNYLPNRTQLLSSNAPPPINPKIQVCLEEDVIRTIGNNGDNLKTAIEQARGWDTSALPDKWRNLVSDSLQKYSNGFTLMNGVIEAKKTLADYLPEYTPLHKAERARAKSLALLSKAEEEGTISSEAYAAEVAAVGDVAMYWNSVEAEFKARDADLKKARNQYFMETDGATTQLQGLRKAIMTGADLPTMRSDIETLLDAIQSHDLAEAQEQIKEMESQLSQVNQISAVKSPLSKARRALKKAGDEVSAAREKAKQLVMESLSALDQEVQWRTEAQTMILPKLDGLLDSFGDTFASRQSERLTDNQAKAIAACLAHHKDISMYF